MLFQVTYISTMAKTIKCDFKLCSVVLGDIEPKITCKSHCKGAYHGSCIGIPRLWSSAPQTSTTKFLLNHFICDDCIKLPDIICKFDDIWSKKFNNLDSKITDNIDLTIKKIADSDLIFDEVSGQLQNLSKSIMDIEERSPFGSPSEVSSLFHELSSAQNSQRIVTTKATVHTLTVATQTDTAATDTASVQASKVIKNKGEWRIFTGKSVWREDWSTHDQNVAKKLQKQEPVATASNKKIAPNKNRKKNIKQQHQPHDNFYDFLTNFDHFEPPRQEYVQHRHQHRHKQPKQMTRRDKAPRQKRPRLETHQQAQPVQPSFLNFVPQHQQAQPVQPQTPQLFQLPQQPAVESHQNFPSTSWASVAAQPSVNISPSEQLQQLPQTVSPQPMTTQPPRQTSFMDPLVPAVVRNTQMSVSQEGRYALSRLRDVQLLKTVRLYLAYLHDKPTTCIEGMTGHHCKLLIGINGLPTDVKSLRKIYKEFHGSFNFNFSPSEIDNDLKTLRSHLSSNRINFLNRTNDNFKQFYNF